MLTNQPALPTTFAEFWPWYMAAHLDRRNRIAHYIGPTGGLIALAATVATGNLWLTGREREAVALGRDLPDIVQAVRAGR
jgi:hypothetical protein